LNEWYNLQWVIIYFILINTICIYMCFYSSLYTYDSSCSNYIALPRVICMQLCSNFVLKTYPFILGFEFFFIVLETNFMLYLQKVD